MATKASKYVYELAAQYSGQSDLKRLQQDLDAIGKIDTYSKTAAQWQKLNQEFATAKQRAKDLRQEMQQNGGDSSSKAYAKASQEVERLSKALHGQKSKLTASANDLKAAGIAASKASEQYQKLQASIQSQGRTSAARSTLGIRSDGSIQKEITGLQKAYRDLARSGTASMAELTRAKKNMNARIAELTGSTTRWNQSLLSANNLMRGAALGIGIGMMARYAAQITGIADQYSQLDAKIRLTVSSDQEAAQIQEKLYQISQKTGTAYAANADAYAKLGMQLKDVGIKGEETVGIVDLVNKSLIVNGSSAEMASSFQLQFAQAMGSGVLQGDEFRAMLESNGYFAGLLAKELGTNIAGLRKMSKEGQLTSDVLLSAFPKMAEEVNSAFSKIPMTVGRARQILDNVFRSLVNDSNKAAGGTSKIADSLIGLAQVIEANREPLTEMIAGMINLGASAVDVAVNIGKFVVANREMLTEIGKYALIFGGGLKFLTMFAGALLQVQIAASTLGGVKLASWAIDAARQMSTLASSSTLAGTAIKGTLALAAAQGAVSIAQLAVELYRVKQAYDELHASEERGAVQSANLAKKYAEISQATGVVITSHQELMAAIDDGKIHQDAATKQWVAGAGQKAAAEKTAATTIKQVTGEALEAMKKKYQEYAREVQRLQGEIVGRERSLQAELREMSRTGMSDYSSWMDRKKEAEEYAAAAKKAAQEAAQAMASGDTIMGKEKYAEALQYADQAKDAYKSLNAEIKAGDHVVVNQTDALKTSMEGVKKAGELGIEIMKQQQKEAKAAMDAMVEKSGFADLTEGMDDAEKKWAENWKNMQSAASKEISAVEEQIVKLVSKDRTVYINVVEREARRYGGIAGGSALHLRKGAKLAGYGGGDRIPAVLEAGEGVLRKEAVRWMGADRFHALNMMQMPDFSGLLGATTPTAAAVADNKYTVNVNFMMPGGRSIPMLTTQKGAQDLREAEARWNRRVSHLGAKR
jgi:tape measure domain-containing protein